MLNGAVVSEALDLALAWDLRTAADEAALHFGGARLATPPTPGRLDAAATHRLAKQEDSCSPLQQSPQTQAGRFGLVAKVAPRAELEQRVRRSWGSHHLAAYDLDPPDRGGDRPASGVAWLAGCPGPAEHDRDDRAGRRGPHRHDAHSWRSGRRGSSGRVRVSSGTTCWIPPHHPRAVPCLYAGLPAAEAVHSTPFARRVG